MDRDEVTYRHLSAFPLEDETHGGEDVAVFAAGPGSGLVRGTFEQNFIAYVMSYAGCMGPAQKLNEGCLGRKGAAGGAMATGAGSIVPKLLISIAFGVLSRVCRF